jgi:hypothetical protein
MSLIDNISARDLIHALYQGGIIELPSLYDDNILEITSCPLHDTYVLRDDLPNVSNIVKEAIIVGTDYDGDNITFDDCVPLNALSEMTLRVSLTIGEV